MSRGRFCQLLRKELANAKGTMFIVLVVIIAWDLFLASRLNLWDKEAVFGLSWIPLGIMPIWALGAGFMSFRQEWGTNHIYLLQSFPVRGITLAGTKIIAILLQSIVYFSVACLGAFLLGSGLLADFASSIPEAIRDQLLRNYAWTGIWLVVMFWLSMAVLAVLGQSAYLVGRLFERFQWFFSAWVLVLNFWMVSRFAALVVGLFGWIPKVRLCLHRYLSGSLVIEKVNISMAPFAALFLGGFLVFAFGAWLLERRIEI
ncbi:MAG: hypothetical protein M0Q40_08430 [Limnochordia bacterium]|nr:hypothetical protein [Limnochordia bacterium]